MIITKVNPCGFCKGVINAIIKINKALINDNYPRPFYMYGSLVHNEHIIKHYIEQNVIIINNLNELDNINNGTVIITAHGASNKLKEKIISKGLKILDTTCIEVAKIHDAINSKLNENYEIIYYGKKNHPESKGILGINNNIHLIENIIDINNLNISSNKIYFANQTTMSYFDLIKIKEEIMKKYPFIQIGDDVCNATKIRQLAIINSAKENDLIIIVGDKSSNNTKNLKEVCIKETSKPCILIDNIKDLKDYNLNNYERIAISAGTSTPDVIINEVINGIKNNDFNSYFKSEDTIKIKN